MENQYVSYVYICHMFRMSSLHILVFVSYFVSESADNSSFGGSEAAVQKHKILEPNERIKQNIHYRLFGGKRHLTLKLE